MEGAHGPLDGMGQWRPTQVATKTCLHFFFFEMPSSQAKNRQEPPTGVSFRFVGRSLQECRIQSQFVAPTILVCFFLVCVCVCLCAACYLNRWKTFILFDVVWGLTSWFPMNFMQGSVAWLCDHIKRSCHNHEVLGLINPAKMLFGFHWSNQLTQHAHF